MTLFKKILISLPIYLSVWFICYFGHWATILKYVLILPFVLAVITGCYFLLNIIKGVLQFNNSTVSLIELKKDLKNCQNKLISLGFDFGKFNIPLIE